MHYVGLDVHQRTSTIHILDQYGRTVKEKTLRGSWHKVVFWLARWKEPFAVCFEASCGNVRHKPLTLTVRCGWYLRSDGQTVGAAACGNMERTIRPGFNGHRRWKP